MQWRWALLWSLCLAKQLSTKYGHVLITKTFEYVIIQGKRDFADVTKLGSLNEEIILDYPSSPI